ncbi:hypothetical protein WA171_000903 [Blastocystis sp. BT1]
MIPLSGSVDITKSTNSKVCKQCGRRKQISAFISKNQAYICIICDACRAIQEKRSRARRIIKKQEQSCFSDTVYDSYSPKHKKKKEELPLAKKIQQSGNQSVFNPSPLVKRDDRCVSHGHHYNSVVPVANWIHVVNFNNDSNPKSVFLARCLFHPLVKCDSSSSVTKYSILYSMK